MTISCCCCWTAVVMLFTAFNLSASTAQNLTRHDQEEYLKKFGYIDEANAGQRVRHMSRAVRRFQRFAGLKVTGVVDAATMQKMAMPRCGVADMQITGSEFKWPKHHLTYRFTPGVGYTPDLPQNTVRKVFQQAFEIWSQVTPLTFSETTSVADIEIAFGARDHGCGSSFDGVGGTLAHAYFPNQGIGGDAHFDEDETWTDESHQGTNLLQVVVHELGHSLGLGHSNVADAIMAPFYAGYKPQMRLHQNDIERIQKLYGQGGGGPVEPVTPGGQPTTPGTGCGGANTFQCHNTGDCISSYWVCDGDNDCGDLSDEQNCGTNTVGCGESGFQCHNTGNCIPAPWICDGDNDCGDMSDEQNCALRPSCSFNEFTCDNQNCIPSAYVCDGDNDCGDMSDEADCGDFQVGCSPEPAEFTCNNQRCIPYSYICDGDNDCEDWSDEVNCG